MSKDYTLILMPTVEQGSGDARHPETSTSMKRCEREERTVAMLNWEICQLLDPVTLTRPTTHRDIELGSCRDEWDEVEQRAVL